MGERLENIGDPKSIDRFDFSRLQLSDCKTCMKTRLI